ncbi:MAG: endonuclease/exonuclease/phosphatase family protein [Bacteroidota bacterium]
MGKILRLLAKIGILALALVIIMGRLYAQVSSWSIYLHFPLHFTLLSCLALPFFLRKADRIFLGIALICLSFNLFQVLSVYVGQQIQAVGPTYSLVSLNLEKANPEPEKVLPYLQEQNPDVLVLLEYTSLWHNRLGTIYKDYPYRRVVLNEGYFGQMIASKYPFQSTACHWLADCHAPTLEVQIRMDSQILDLWAFHPPSPPNVRDLLIRDEILRNWESILEERPAHILIVGDFNITPFHPVFQDFLEANELQDSRKGRGYHASWPTRWKNLGIPLDHALHSADIVIKKRVIGSDVGSDHYPLELRWGFGT